MKIFSIAILLLASLCVHATDAEKSIQTQAEQKFKKTFNNVSTVTAFNESPIPGIWEMNMNGNIVYYYPDKELLFFGEIYDKGGISLTKESLRKTAKKKISKLEEGVALKVGDDSGKVIIEIMDPDCPYCRKYHDYIEKASQDINIDRRILLDPRIHQSAIPKIKHIICSNDPKRAYEAVMSGAVKEYQDCPNSEAIMAKHVEQIDMLGVNATPSFVINSQVVMGFDKEKIEAYLRSSN